MYTDQDISNLVARVQQLEQQASLPGHRSLPDLGILSRNFLTRAFSVWGLYFVAQLLIGIVITCVTVLLGLAIGTSFTDLLRNILNNVPAGY